MANIEDNKKSRKKMDGFWEQAEINRLIEMVFAGANAAEIAEDIGTSRNAVIGKARRIKIKWPSRAKEKPIVKKPAPVAVKIRTNKVRWQDMMTASSKNLPGDGCLFPIDDGWCGKKTHGPYCAEHRAIVYTQAKPKKIHIPKETSPNYGYL